MLGTMFAITSYHPQSSSGAHQGVANREDEKATDRVAYGSARYHAGSAAGSVQTVDGLFCTDGGVLVGSLCQSCSVALAKVHVRCEVPYRGTIPTRPIVHARGGDRHAAAAIGRGRGKNKGCY